MSIKKISGCLFLLSGFVMASSVSAEELILTSEKGRNGNSVAIDLITDGSAVAFQFNIALPKGVSGEDVDLSKCVAELPASHSGQCNVAKGQIIGLVYNDQNVALPAGLIPVGKISIKGQSAVRSKLNVSYFEVNDKFGKELPVRTSVSAEK